MLAANSSFVDELKSEMNVLEPDAELPVRVVTVPKTLKTPRIIAIEPTCMQYVQQGLMRLFVDGIQGDDILRNFIGFDDQSPNQRLARKGSRKGTLATLDLSEASDRVSNQHVEMLLKSVPYLSGAVDSCRSSTADLDGEVFKLAKFASMGSALTFPIEAMVFLTVIFLGIESTLNTSLCPQDLKRYYGQVRVYGDDIIIPVDCVEAVIEKLEAFGFVVNSTKSFWTGRYRESCGREYYAGEDISIIRVRHLFPTSRQHATEAISLVSLRNQFYKAGYWRTCAWLDDVIQGVLRYFPVVHETSSVLGRHSFLPYQGERLCEHTHNPLVKGYRVTSRLPESNLDGYDALLKVLGKLSDLPFADPDHLLRAGRPQVVNIKLGYCRPF